jgi:glycosidase
LACHHRLEDLFRRYSWEVVTAQMNILTSHDTPRIYSLLRGQLERVRLAFAMLFTLPGAPTVYYGEEIGMAGGHDPDNRRGMIWDEERWHKPLQQTIQQMSALRRSKPALRRGRYQYLYAHGSHLAFARTFEHTSLVVTINAACEPWRVSIPLHGLWPRGEQAIDLLSGKTGCCVGGYLEDGVVEPFSLAVWQPLE